MPAIVFEEERLGAEELGETNGRRWRDHVVLAETSNASAAALLHLPTALTSSGSDKTA